VLAYTAVGLTMQILTPWHPAPVETAFLEYDGNTGTMTPSARHTQSLGRPYSHYPDDERGDVTSGTVTAGSNRDISSPGIRFLAIVMHSTPV